MEIKVNSGDTAVEKAENPIMPTKNATKAKSKVQASHPPTSKMVGAAIKALKDCKGSSMQAIKKYIVATYKVDGDKSSPYIKRYLKAALISGAVVQTKGKGASGSFKLSAGKNSENSKLRKLLQAPKKSESKKIQLAKKKIAAEKMVASKKPASPKKAVTEKKAAMKKSTTKAAVAKPRTVLKTISKAKKTTKAPAAKTRIPKPKKTVTSKAVKSVKK